MISDEDIARQWGLSYDDVEFINARPKAMRVGLAAQLVPSTLSGHLAILRRAGLLKSVRHQREIRYSADIEAMNALISFLLQDCCNGQMDNCSEILTLLKSPEGQHQPLER